MMNKPSPTAAYVRSNKHISVGALTTLDAFECVSSGEEEVETVVSDIPSSGGAEPTEAGAEAALDEMDGQGATELGRILLDLGFSDALSDEPLLVVRGPEISAKAFGQPPRLKNLFWRQYVTSKQRSGSLTTENLQKHTAAQPPSFPFGKMFEPANVGEWLLGFKAYARSVPVRDFTARLLGEDLGSDVANFVGEDAMLSDFDGNTMVAGDEPDGHYVVASRARCLRVPSGAGRSGFIVDDLVSISTPGERSTYGSSAGSEGADEDAAEDEVDIHWPLSGGGVAVAQSRAFDGRE